MSKVEPAMTRDELGDKATTKEGLDPGLTANVAKQMETHVEFLKRVLEDEEQVYAHTKKCPHSPRNTFRRKPH